MKVYKSLHEVSNLLIKKAIGVIPTDTVYGLVGCAMEPQVVERIYQVKKRDEAKPLIILIASVDDLSKFEIYLSDKHVQFLNLVWPGPVSVVMPCVKSRFEYLHRGTNALAFRIADNRELESLLRQTGPLVAPSANFEGEETATTISTAQDAFHDTVDFYVDAGEITSFPSTLIRLESEGFPKILRSGAMKDDDIIKTYSSLS